MYYPLNLCISFLTVNNDPDQEECNAIMEEANELLKQVTRAQGNFTFSR